MRVRLLGTSAGGGFPQWNCNCLPCRTSRSDPFRAVPRTQCTAAISSDGERWFLLNASPDLRTQIESFQPLRRSERAVRGAAIDGVLLTNADLDHTLGLFLLREGAPLSVHATRPIRAALEDGLRLSHLLDRYCGVRWSEAPKRFAPLLVNGERSGLEYCAVGTSQHPPRYLNQRMDDVDFGVAYVIRDSQSGRKLVFAPDIQHCSPAFMSLVVDADLLLIDGTFWSNDEMSESGTGSASSAQMGHIPVSGSRGSLSQLQHLPGRKVFVHINNTNPILLEDSPQRAEVIAAGFEVGRDGMEFIL